MEEQQKRKLFKLMSYTRDLKIKTCCCESYRVFKSITGCFRVAMLYILIFLILSDQQLLFLTLRTLISYFYVAFIQLLHSIIAHIYPTLCTEQGIKCQKCLLNCRQFWLPPDRRKVAQNDLQKSNVNIRLISETGNTWDST